jgi:hypothetical protein
MDWRISIRGIWDIQGRDKGKKRNTPPHRQMADELLRVEKEKKNENHDGWKSIFRLRVSFRESIREVQNAHDICARLALKKTERNQIHKGDNDVQVWATKKNGWLSSAERARFAQGPINRSSFPRLSIKSRPIALLANTIENASAQHTFFGWEISIW